MLPCELYEGVCQCHIPSVNGGQSQVLPLKTTSPQHTHPLPCLAVPTHTKTIRPCPCHGLTLTSASSVKLCVLSIYASQLRMRRNKGDGECQRRRSVISQTWLISLATLIFVHTNQKFQSHETLGMQRGSG